jgi:glycolate oxidase FAD binding subunit
VIDLAGFAEEIGTEGSVSVVGASTREGAVAGARAVRAPAGIDVVNPAEMTVVCGAGTPLAELDAALDAVGQSLAVGRSSGAGGGTIGGALALAASSVLRLGLGPVRDCLLQARVVMADGVLVKAGGPTVKNVSGFDLCRLLVGSRGTLAAFGEVTVRTRPKPLCRRWFTTDGRDPWAVRRDLFRPSAILWDGTRTWVCLDGHPIDVADQAAGARLTAADGPPVVPTAARRSMAPAELRTAAPATLGAFVAEIGVGIVHLAAATADEATSFADDRIVELNRRIKQQYDPARRFNPGREPVALHPTTGGTPT